MIGTDARFSMGMVADWRGQPFEVLARRPYRRKDGRPTLILIWATHCLACGTPFETTTPQRAFKYPTRRCPAHRGSRSNRVERRP
jgi:hypothetical protein